MAYNVLMCR